MSHDELAPRRRLRSGQELRERLRAGRERDPGPRPEAVNLDPATMYEVLTRQMVSDLTEELREIRLRVNGLLFLTTGAVIADIVLRLAR